MPSTCAGMSAADHMMREVGDPHALQRLLDVIEVRGGGVHGNVTQKGPHLFCHAAWALRLAIMPHGMHHTPHAIFTLHCTELQCTALHGTALNCTELHCMALRRTLQAQEQWGTGEERAGRYGSATSTHTAATAANPPLSPNQDQDQLQEQQSPQPKQRRASLSETTVGGVVSSVIRTVTPKAWGEGAGGWQGRRGQEPVPVVAEMLRLGRGGLEHSVWRELGVLAWRSLVDVVGGWVVGWAAHVHWACASHGTRTAARLHLGACVLQRMPCNQPHWPSGHVLSPPPPPSWPPSSASLRTEHLL